MDSATLLALAMTCAPQVDAGTARALIAVESGANPHAIGVAGGALDRQPRNRAEAIATARALQASNWNFSVGLAQVNLRNLDRLGLTVEDAFEPCANLAAMQAILIECFERTPWQHPLQHASQRALRQVLSCYYSGNFVTGFEHGYVHRVTMAARQPRTSPIPKEAP